MKTTKLPQAGIGHIAIVFAVVFVAVVGFAGWQVFSSNKNASVADKASTASAQVPDKIQTKADLVQTSKALDSSSTNVNSNLNDNALNAKNAPGYTGAFFMPLGVNDFSSYSERTSRQPSRLALLAYIRVVQLYDHYYPEEFRMPKLGALSRLDWSCPCRLPHE
jgi:hypothetical protein